MSKFYMENEMEYLKDLSEAEKVVFLKVLKRLAQVDGTLDGGEAEFIKDLALVFGVGAEHRDEIMKTLSDDEVVKEAETIKDRRKALELIKEMCLLANSDSDLSDKEVLLIGRVGQAMKIELEKIQQISQWVIDRLIWIEEGKIIFERF